MSNIKIMIACHKKTDVISTENFLPIQLGCANTSLRLPNMLYDDTGENISEKNRQYCELTGQYWMWKNVEADYYGLMHYRRYFSFNEDILEEDTFGNITYNCLDEEALSELGYTENSIHNIVENYDVVSLVPQDVTKLSKAKNVYEHYKISDYHRIEDLDLVKEIIEEKYPEYTKAMNSYLKGKQSYFCNMYILKKEVFDSYNQWLFDILAEHEKRSDFSDYDINEYRVSGFLAERLWGIYYTKIKMDRKYKCREIQKAYFINTDPAPDIVPAFESKNVPIVIAADDKYVPYVTVMLRSMIANASNQRNYDVIVLHSSITKKHQARIHEEFLEDKNLSIRFYNIAYLYSGIKMQTHFHITIETYYRLLMQDIMKNYEKVLYIDSDLVVLDDISKLYDTDMSGYCLGAVKDIDMAGNYHGKDPKRKEYFKTTLTMKQPYNYINAGVLVMNLAEFRKNYTRKKIIETIQQENWMYMDQDILNYMCEGKIKFLDMSWNVVMNWETANESRMDVIKCSPYQLYLEYVEAHKHPKIAHYAGFQKPWDCPECDMGEYFWKYAEMTKDVVEELKERNKNQVVYTPANNSQFDIPLYEDGFYVKLINKINKSFPLDSRRRELLKKFAKVFMR